MAVEIARNGAKTKSVTIVTPEQTQANLILEILSNAKSQKEAMITVVTFDEFEQMPCTDDLLIVSKVYTEKEFVERKWNDQGLE